MSLPTSGQCAQCARRSSCATTPLEEDCPELQIVAKKEMATNSNPTVNTARQATSSQSVAQTLYFKLEELNRLQNETTAQEKLTACPIPSECFAYVTRNSRKPMDQEIEIILSIICRIQRSRMLLPVFGCCTPQPVDGRLSGADQREAQHSPPNRSELQHIELSCIHVTRYGGRFITSAVVDELYF
jgi:hypothetical protein